MKVFPWNKIKYGDRIVTQCGDKNVILHNVNNNKTVKISKEVFDVIDEICKSGWEIKKVLKKCETNADREILLDNLIYKLIGTKLKKNNKKEKKLFKTKQNPQATQP